MKSKIDNKATKKASKTLQDAKTNTTDKIITPQKNAAPAVVKDAQIAIHCKFDKLIDPNNLKPHPANPARHPKAQVELLAKIIQSHGVRHPIIVSNLSGYIVSGHCRREASILLGMKEYPVVYQNYKDQSEELAVLVADNQIQELAEIDGRLMGDIIVELDQMNYPLELTALNEEEIKYYVEGPIAPPPDVDIQGEVEGLSEYMIIQFDTVEEINKVRENLKLTPTQKVVLFEIIKEAWQIEI